MGSGNRGTGLTSSFPPPGDGNHGAIAGVVLCPFSRYTSALLVPAEPHGAGLRERLGISERPWRSLTNDQMLSVASGQKVSRIDPSEVLGPVDQGRYGIKRMVRKALVVDIHRGARDDIRWLKPMLSTQ